MLQINELTITHRKDLRVILEKFNLVLNDGDKAVIIGEEGNGKSTLMRFIYDPSLAEEYTECHGKRVLGKERLAYLPQELPEGDREKSVYEFFSENDCFWNQTQNDLADYAKRFLVENEFFYRDQKMKTLSGGEKIKAQLMKLLMQEPTVLLLDEPSNDIDIATLELLEKIMKEWKHILLYISHDETLIEETANMIIHLEQVHRKTVSRATVKHLSYREYVTERYNSFQKQEQLAENERREKRIRDEKIRKLEQKLAGKMDHIAKADRDHIGQVMKKKMKAIKSIENRYEKADAELTQMPEMEEAIFFKLGKKESFIPAGKTVIEFELPVLRKSGVEEEILSKDIFLRMRGAEKICIIGKNGVGKTTLLKIIAENLLSRQDLKVQYMPQNYEDMLNLLQTPVDFLDSSGDKEERTRIRTYLGSLKYTADEMDHPISELSGGQKAKILLLKMSLSDANVLILDEPTRNFSPLSGPVIRKMLKEFPGAVISISHDRKYIGEVCDKVYELTKDGLQVKDGYNS